MVSSVPVSASSPPDSFNVHAHIAQRHTRGVGGQVGGQKNRSTECLSFLLFPPFYVQTSSANVLVCELQVQVEAGPGS